MKWNETLSVGNAIIDNQHRSLLEALEDLLSACNARKGRDEIGKTLDFLAEYTVSHFRDEEKYMADKGFPGLAQHKAVHDKFVAEVSAFIEKYKKEGASIAIIIELNGRLNEWVIEHIMKMDKEYCKFIRNGAC